MSEGTDSVQVGYINMQTVVTPADYSPILISDIYEQHHACIMVPSSSRF